MVWADAVCANCWLCSIERTYRANVVPSPDVTNDTSRRSAACRFGEVLPHTEKSRKHCADFGRRDISANWFGTMETTKAWNCYRRDCCIAKLHLGGSLRDFESRHGRAVPQRTWSAVADTRLRPLKNHPENKDWRSSPFLVFSNAVNPLLQYRGAAAGRNVVLIVLESTSARYWPSGDSAIDPMPNLTALASQGISFEHAYAVYPESIKGLFSVLCSRYPAFDVAPEVYSRITCPALPRELGSAGYRTALFHSGRFTYLGMPAIIEKRGFEVLEDAGAIGGNIHSSFGVDDSSTVKRLLSWIDSLKQGERFFVMYLPVAGHHPYATPERGPFTASGENGEMNRYLNALHYGDRALGELLSGLRVRDLDRNTLFVLFGDQCEAFGPHDGNFRHTLFIYDENIHVPY